AEGTNFEQSDTRQFLYFSSNSQGKGVQIRQQIPIAAAQSIGIEATSGDKTNHRERPAWDSLRTVFQGLGSCSGLRGDLRICLCQVRLLPTWSA
ncbi:MAG: hypothetical protein ACRECZ_04000, partial [Methylocella sp.]